MLFAIGAGPQVVAVSSFDRLSARGQEAAERRRPARSRRRADPVAPPGLVVVYGSQTDLPRSSNARRSRVRLPPRRPRRHHDDDPRARRARRARRGADRACPSRSTRARGIRPSVAGRPRPTTLLVFGRDALALRGIYASGGVGFLHDMLTAAGGDNVFADVKQQSVQATTELILARRPEVILELRRQPLPSIATEGDRRVERAAIGPGRADRPRLHPRRRAHRDARARAWPRGSSSSPGRCTPRRF